MAAWYVVSVNGKQKPRASGQPAGLGVLLDQWATWRTVLATCPQVHTPEVVLPPEAVEERVGLEDDGLGAWRTQSAKAEAKMLFAMVGRGGETVESIRELIQVPAKIEASLRTYAQRFPEHAAGIDGVIEFRRQVGEDLDRKLPS